MATQLQSFELIGVRPLSPALGAEITGVDLSQTLDPSVVAEIMAAWAEYNVLLFRGQDISEDDQFRFARLFGPISERVQPPVETRPAGPDNYNKMMLVSDRVGEDGRPLGALGHGEMFFHTDKCYIRVPHRASFLYSMEVPSEGGHTKYASLVRAYENLPPDLRKRLEGRKVLQAYSYGQVLEDRVDPDCDLSKVLHHWQPLFVTLPESGRKGAYVSRLMSILIEGMDTQESREILDLICDIVEAPENIYEHVWRVGDLVVWDNFGCVHARTDWPDEQPRSLRRCTVDGEALT